MNLRSTVSLALTGAALAAVAVLSSACSSTPKSVDAQRLESVGARNLAQPSPGILTAGQPTPEQFEALAGMGVTRFINLRAPGESGTGWEEAAAARLGVTYANLPIASADDISEANAVLLASMLASDEPVLVYCGSSNRVGALMGLKGYVVDGMTVDEALAYGEACGVTRMRPVLEEKLGAATATSRPSAAGGSTPKK